MSELGPQALAALDALQKQAPTDLQRERVRARLLSLGVAASAAGGGSLLAGTAAAATSAASGPLVSGAVGAPAVGVVAGGAASAGAVTGAMVQVGVSGSSMTASGTLLAAATKLAALPLALKLGAVAVTLAGALSVPYVVGPANRSAPGAIAEAGSRRAPAAPRASVATPAAPTMKLELPEEAVVELSPLPAEPVVTQLVPPDKVARPVEDPRAVRQPTPAAAELQQTASSLAAESALLADALSALRSGDMGQARQLLDQHERDFARHPLLERERERMRRELAELKSTTSP